ncbi:MULTISPECIES: DUF502 domain-containing protein [unclassified Thioalkalivibrio]|uniref:DUF502 domain-containing protein n=1 Tax=unclassified Thioalkalivibrio TaxID=2621013 RepID=UPI0003628CAA|nr:MULTISPECIES: DUF502 domain-containing protein [unclassified Thioalkalivibrio]PYG02589.1 putative membrane protein [Thioalkalivibrio sp. ALE21]
MLAALRRYVIAGLLVWLPLVVTGYVIKLLVDLLDYSVLVLPEAWRPEAWLGFDLPGAGVVLAVAIVLVTGMIVANIVGRRLVHLGEAVVRRIPLVSTIYGAVKQVTETVFTNGGESFRKVVMIEYPRRGTWSIAFLTGTATPETRERTGEDMVTVFVPTAPNPTSGFVLLTPRTEVTELDMSVEDGLKFVMSLGVVIPSDDPVSAPLPVARDGGRP